MTHAEQPINPWLALCESVEDDLSHSFADVQTARMLMQSETGYQRQLIIFTSEALRIAEWADARYDFTCAPEFPERYRALLEEKVSVPIDTTEEDKSAYPLSTFIPEDFGHPSTRKLVFHGIMSRLINQTGEVWQEIAAEKLSTRLTARKEGVK